MSYSYNSKRTWSDEERYSKGEFGNLAKTLRKLEDAGKDIDRVDSGHYTTDNSTILPDGTEVMDM